MQHEMNTISQVTALIEQGKRLLLAGDEDVLRQLPSGSWIGGTIPYFMTKTGGLSTKDQIYVSELPDYIQSVKIVEYDTRTISNIYRDIPDGGFGFVIMPTSTPIQFEFGLNAPQYPEFAHRPLLGWVSGVFLDDLGSKIAKVFNGRTVEAPENKAVAMLIELPATKISEIGIVNIFSQGEGDSISFEGDGFEASDALINGEKRNFAEYITRNGIDTRLPLVADYFGASINVSLQTVDQDHSQVSFYAPVFHNVTYKFAKPLTNYVDQFTSLLPHDENSIVFSCNCILNYVYLDLEHQRLGNIGGPITFGEIAYQLLNQTLVYLTIYDV